MCCLYKPFAELKDSPAFSYESLCSEVVSLLPLLEIFSCGWRWGAGEDQRRLSKIPCSNLFFFDHTKENVTLRQLETI